MTELLSAALEEFASGARLQADWNDVLERSGHRSRPRLRRPVLAVAMAVVLFGSVSAAVAVTVSRFLTQQEHFHAALPDDPGRLGPMVQIASGETWALIAWRSEVGLCLDFAVTGNSPFGCGFPVRGAKPDDDATGSGRPVHAVAGFFSGSKLAGGDGKATVFGVAAHEVERVTVELRDGRVIQTSTYDAPGDLRTDVRFFIVRFPIGALDHSSDDPVRAYNAYAADGSLIEHLTD